LQQADAAGVSELSHGFWWRIAKDREEIPIEVAIVQPPDEVSPTAQKHAQSLEGRAAKLLAA